jgi:hypothetical protein
MNMALGKTPEVQTRSRAGMRAVVGSAGSTVAVTAVRKDRTLTSCWNRTQRFHDQAQANIASTVADVTVHSRSALVLAATYSMETVPLLHLGSYFDVFILGPEVSVSW